MMVSISYNLLQNNTEISHFEKELLRFSAEVTKTAPTGSINSRSSCQTMNTNENLIFYALHSRQKLRVHGLLSEYSVQTAEKSP